MEEEWISAAEAFRRVKDATDGKRAAGLICSRANDELIATKARRFIVDDLVHDYTPVPKQFWWRRADSWLMQDWTTGDFETVSYQRERCRAYGVEFLKKDIDAMLPIRLDGRAFSELKPGNYAAANQCIQELKSSLGMEVPALSELILQNCSAGLVPSRCTRLWWRVTTRYGSEEDVAENAPIPDWVWEHCLSAPDAVLNWTSNAFAGEGIVNDDPHKVKVTGVQFEVQSIIDIENLVKSTRPMPARSATDGSDKHVVLATPAPASLPPLSEAALLKWWDAKAAVRDLLTVEELVALIRAAHPQHTVTRDRVRNLSRGRKRGPKPFGGKSSAE